MNRILIEYKDYFEYIFYLYCSLFSMYIHSYICTFFSLRIVTYFFTFRFVFSVSDFWPESEGRAIMSDNLMKEAEGLPHLCCHCDIVNPPNIIVLK